MFNEVHNDNTTSLPTGWFLVGTEGAPMRSRCSVGAAVQSGLVMRHERPGHLYLPDGRGTRSFESAIAEGLIDQAAAEFIAKQPGCYRSAPMAGVVLPPLGGTRQGPLGDHTGTPVGAFVNALQSWRRNPDSVDELRKVADALEAALR